MLKDDKARSHLFKWFITPYAIDLSLLKLVLHVFLQLDVIIFW